MGDEFHKSIYIDTTWTNKASDDFIKSNFADLEFFKFCVPFIKAQGVHVAIASFGEEDAEAVLSGLPLIRKYLDLAFGPAKSKDLFPDHTIALWHPEKKGKDEKKVGKTDHIAEIVKKLGGKLKNSELVLFDDDANNISIGKKKGVNCIYCPATKDLLEEGKDSGFNRHIWAAFIQKMKSGGSCVLM